MTAGSGRFDESPIDLLRRFPAPLMRMWSISTRVNKPDNDDAAILDPAAEREEENLL